MQTEYFGKGTLSKIAVIIEKHRVERVFLVTGRRSFHSSGASCVLDEVLQKCQTCIFDSFSVNPKLTEALRGIELIKDFQPDLIIAIGGGSVLDMGKLITCLESQEADNYASIIRDSRVVRKGLPFVAVPTTAGTGSEATRFAVVYIEGVKYSLAHKFILPDYSIIDPSLSSGMPPYQTAVCAMDALCQAVESYWSVNATDESSALSVKAITAIKSNILAAVLFGSTSAKEKIAYAANLSGKAINITETTAPHAISYALTSQFNIPHGHAVALCLGYFFTINHTYADTISDSLQRALLQTKMANIYSMFGCSDAESCSKLWYDLMEQIGLETDFNTLGVTSDNDRELIADSVNRQRLENHPVDISREIILSLFRSS